MNKLKVLFALLLLTCAAGASAQDVIVKKDGSTVVCRVVEVSAFEIVYKKWTDLNGSNYVMNRADASVINYENGTRSEMGTASTNSTETTSSVVLNPQSQQLSDRQLMQILSTPTSMKKAKCLQKIGWIGGSCIIALGIPFAIIGISDGAFDGSYTNALEKAHSKWVTGAVIAGSGLAIGTTCVIVGKRMEKKAQNELLYSSFWQEEFRLQNETTIMPSVGILQDRHMNTLGLGLRYSF